MNPILVRAVLKLSRPKYFLVSVTVGWIGFGLRTIVGSLWWWLKMENSISNTAGYVLT